MIKKQLIRLLQIATFALLITNGLLGQENTFQKKTDEYIKPYVETKNFSGTILVAQRGKIIYHKAFGMADEDFNITNKTGTIYHIASLSKSFTAAAILILEEKKLLSVDDNITKYVPDFPGGEKITIHHLLTHTSGIPNINNMPEYDSLSRFAQTPASLLAIFKNKPLDFEPGKKYSYSNSNYNLLAYIIEKVSGKSYGLFLEENIFGPLKMKNTAHHFLSGSIIKNCAVGYESDGNFGLQKPDFLDWTTKTGNGSVYSTTADLYKWDRALYSEKIISKKSAKKMFRVYMGHAGYGWFLDKHLDHDRIYFNGKSPGFTSYFGRYAADDVCIIVLANNYVPVATQIGMDLAAMLFNKPYPGSLITNTRIDSVYSNQLIGSYQFDDKFYRPGFIMTITEKNHRLFSDWGELIHKNNYEYIGRVYWSTIKFEKDNSGKMTINYDGFKGIKIDSSQNSLHH